MLNYRSTTITFFIVMLVAIPYSLFYPFPIWIFGFTLMLYLTIIGIGSAKIQLNFFLKSYCQGDEASNMICLTFDDGPNKHTTPALLDILKQANVKAGFFCIGKNILGNEEIVKRMYREGHTIGNHSFSHSYFFDFYPWKKVENELAKTENLIQKIIGVSTRFFRPPYGVTNPAISKASKTLDYFSIGWSVRSMDTVLPEHKALAKIKSTLKPGAIVLLHDTDHKVLAIVKELIVHASEQNYQIVSPEKLLKLDAYRNTYQARPSKVI